MHSRRFLLTFAAVSATALFAQSPAATETATINGKTITIKYSAPKVNGREGKIFTKDGLIGRDRTYPVWRAGANSATAFHTDADLDIAGLAVPKGDYTLFVDIGDAVAGKRAQIACHASHHHDAGSIDALLAVNVDLGRIACCSHAEASLVDRPLQRR